MFAFKKSVERLSRVFDQLAGWCLVAAVALIIGNILLRVLFSRPFMGTYEFVGYIVSVVIAFSLANCAFRGGHIAVGFIFERFPGQVKKILGIAIHSISFLFITFLSWSVFRYAGSMAKSGEVSSTTEIPYFPFVFLVSCCLLMLCLVILDKLIDALKGAGER